MGFSVAVWGRVDLPAEGFASWRGARVDATHDDWTGDFAAPFPRATIVTKHLARWAKDSALAYRVRGATLTVRGILDEDTYQCECAEIAATFRAAAEHGGKGELVFVGLGADISCVVRVRDGRSSFSDVPERPEWRSTIEELITASRHRFEETPIGKAKRAAKDEAEARAKTLRTSTDAALAAIFQALEPAGPFYNPTEEPTKSAMERLRTLDDARIAPWAMARLEGSWRSLSVVSGLLYSDNLISLIVHYRYREARGLLATIHATKSARFDVKIIAARALLELATDDEIRSVFRAPRRTVAERWAKPNAKIDTALVKKLAKR